MTNDTGDQVSFRRGRVYMDAALFFLLMVVQIGSTNFAATLSTGCAHAGIGIIFQELKVAIQIGPVVSLKSRGSEIVDR